MKKLLITAAIAVSLAGCKSVDYEYTIAADGTKTLKARETMTFWEDDMKGFEYNHSLGTLKVERRQTKTDNEAIATMAGLVEKLMSAYMTMGASQIAPAAKAAVDATSAK